MKLKVTDVVTMAWNDHRISLENDQVKVEVVVKDTINDKDENPFLELKKFDEDIDLFQVEKVKTLSQKISKLTAEKKALEKVNSDLAVENKSLEKTIDDLTSENKQLKAKP